MSDFEPGLINVVRAEVSLSCVPVCNSNFFQSQFVAAKHSSCYFHFTQALYRAIQRLGLSSDYNTSDDVKRCGRQLMALPLLPEAVIEDMHDELEASMSTTIQRQLKGLLE